MRWKLVFPHTRELFYASVSISTQSTTAREGDANDINKLFKWLYQPFVTPTMKAIDYLHLQEKKKTPKSLKDCLNLSQSSNRWLPVVFSCFERVVLLLLCFQGDRSKDDWGESLAYPSSSVRSWRRSAALFYMISKRHFKNWPED